MTLFVTFEYLNKILLSEKGFKNFPEKANSFLWNEEEDINNDSTLTSSNYYKMFTFLYALLKSKAITKNFIINSYCNLLSQIIRILWNETGACSFILEEIFDSLIKNVFFILKAKYTIIYIIFIEKRLRSSYCYKNI